MRRIAVTALFLVVFATSNAHAITCRSLASGNRSGGDSVELRHSVSNDGRATSRAWLRRELTSKSDS